MNIDFKTDDLKPLREKIATSIRDSIIEGRIKPGERLTEPEVAGILGISRTPLREAFLQLESEGFLRVNPRKGAVVTEVSAEDANEIYLIKGSLEALAARLASKFITPQHTDELLRLNKLMEKIAKSKDKDYKEFLELNMKFHAIISECSGSDKLKRLLTTLRNQTLRYNYIYISSRDKIKESVDEHYLMIDALEKKNGNKIEQLVKKHSDSARKALAGLVNH
jgi:DNA-binding GntR family transcriptional regulator